MEELNLIKFFKKDSAGSEWFYDVKQNFKIGLSLFIYFGFFFTLLFSFWMFKDEKYYSIVILGAMGFSLWGDYFISEELKEKNLFRYKTLLLIIFLVISSFQIYLVNFLIAIALTLNIIIANHMFLVYSIIIKVDKVANTGLLPNSFLVRGLIIIYENIESRLKKTIPKIGLLLDYITVKGWFSNKKWYPEVLDVVDKIKVDIFSDIFVNNAVKNDFLASNVNVLNFSHYLLSMKDKKVRDAYLFFFRISSNPSSYTLNSTLEFMSRLGNIGDIEVRDKACIFLDLLYKDIKKNKFFTRVSIWSYNAKELEEKYRNGNNEDIYAEMKEHWKLLKELEPNIFKYLIQNKLNIYPYLFLQDFILEQKEIDYLTDYEQQCSQKLVILDKRMEHKNYKRRQDVLLRVSEVMKKMNSRQYNTAGFRLYNIKPDMYQFFERKNISNLHFGIMNLFDEMMSIDSKLVFEKDLVLFWKIADYEQWDLLSHWGFLEKNGSRYVPINITPFKENPLFTKVREAQWMDDNIVINTKEEKQTIIKF